MSGTISQRNSPSSADPKCAAPSKLPNAYKLTASAMRHKGSILSYQSVRTFTSVYVRVTTLAF